MKTLDHLGLWSLRQWCQSLSISLPFSTEPKLQDPLGEHTWERQLILEIRGSFIKVRMRKMNPRTPVTHLSSLRLTLPSNAMGALMAGTL